jgi:hypothetical protein
MSLDWELLFPLVSVKKLVRNQSEHSPFLLDTGDNIVLPRNKEFKFDTTWLQNEEFLERVSEIWLRPVNSSDPIDVLNIKLKSVKKYFKGWGSNLFGHMKKKKADLRKELDSLEQMEGIAELSPIDVVKNSDYGRAFQYSRRRGILLAPTITCKMVVAW